MNELSVSDSITGHAGCAFPDLHVIDQSFRSKAPHLSKYSRVVTVVKFKEIYTSLF